MCDTLVAMHDAVKDGSVILAKNSDREPNEAQNITFVPAAEHPAGSTVLCTYIEIPQVPHTYAALLSRPFWMFGAEMGVNEHSVAIGNEAVFTKEKYGKTGLTGMDMLRLALERSRSAAEAKDVILGLLNEHGQGGNCGYDHTLYYHNSFLIADTREALVLETAGKNWSLRKVRGTASISNCLTIDTNYDDIALCKKGAEPRAKKKGFTGMFSDMLFTHFAKGRVRKALSGGLLDGAKGRITPVDMMRFLRDHNMPEPYRPGVSPMERLCLHAGGLVSTQSTGSMVAVLREGACPLVYFTGTSAPCLGIFKPHTILPDQRTIQWNGMEKRYDNGSVDLYGSAAGEYDPDTLWWTGEEMHRRALMNYRALAPRWQEQRDALEISMISEIQSAWKNDGTAAFMERCKRHAKQLVEEQKEAAGEMKALYGEVTKQPPFWFRRQWNGFNRKAKFEM